MTTVYHSTQQQFSLYRQTHWKYLLLSPLVLGLPWITTAGYLGYLLVAYDWHAMSIWYSFPLLTSLMFIYIAAVILSFGVCVSVCLMYQTNYGSIFKNKQQSAKIQGDVESVLDQLGCHVSNNCLRTVLPEVTRALDEVRTSGNTTLPSGFNIESRDVLKISDTNIFEIVLREALHEWITYDSHVEDTWYEDASDLAWDEIELPALAQDYILSTFPELILSCPLRFTAEHMERARPGFSTVVYALKEISQTNKEMRLHARNWYSTTQSNVQAEVATVLPVDIV